MPQGQKFMSLGQLLELPYIGEVSSSGSLSTALSNKLVNTEFSVLFKQVFESKKGIVGNSELCSSQIEVVGNAGTYH